MAPGKVTIAWELLSIIATLLPLTAILLQFMIRFYEQRDVESKDTAQYVVVLTLSSVLTLILGGFVAGDIIKLQTDITRIETTIQLIQMSIILLMGSILYLSHDILLELFNTELWVLNLILLRSSQEENSKTEVESKKSKSDGDTSPQDYMIELEEEKDG